MATKTMRTVRRCEKPRPLKTTDSSLRLQSLSSDVAAEQAPNDKSPVLSGDAILENLKCLHVSISNGNLSDNTLVLIGHVCSQLKDAGKFLELSGKDQLDKYFVTLRNASRDERVAMHIRMRLLEIIELRAMGWKSNNNIISYYEQKIVNVEQNPALLIGSTTVPASPLMTSMSTSSIPTSLFHPPTLMTSATQVSLGPGEILRNSGKFIKPTKIPGKNFFKDEILIRNSDSGKVSPGAKDRLVQITGPHEENISRAKVLIEDTIRRNASPVRDAPELGSLGGLVTSGSCTSLNSNSSASEESLQNQPVSVPFQAPQNLVHPAPLAFQHLQPVQQQTQQQHQTGKPISLMHSFSMGSNSFGEVGEYSYTIAVGPNSIRISGSEAEVVRTAKLVLEEYFAGQAEISHNPFSADGLSAANPLKRQIGIIERQSTLDSENGSGSLSNGHLANSSSEEETFKAEGSPPDRVSELPYDPPQMDAFMPMPKNVLMTQQQLMLDTASQVVNSSQPSKLESPSQIEHSNNLSRSSVAVLRQPLFPASKQDDFKLAELTDDTQALAAKSRRAIFGRSSSQKDSKSQERSFERQESEERIAYNRTQFCLVSNSYSFLLDCAASDGSKVMPEELKSVQPDVAAIIVQENPKEYFDPVAYQASASNRKNSSSPKVSTGPEEIWDIE